MGIAKKSKTLVTYATRVLIKAGDDLLSRYSHYHGPQVLNGRVRNGNGCGHLGMVTGKTLRLVRSQWSVVRSKCGDHVHRQTYQALEYQKGSGKSLCMRSLSVLMGAYPCVEVFSVRIATDD